MTTFTERVAAAINGELVQPPTPRFAEAWAEFLVDSGVVADPAEVERLRAALNDIAALGEEWATQSTDYDDDTEQQIQDGRTIRDLLARHGVTTDQAEQPAVIDAAHLERQRAWSTETFGPGDRLHGVLDHIRKELAEIEADPRDVTEWVDVLILAFDGAWRAGWEPQQIIDAVKAKQARNEARTWPDWRTASPDKAIEHVRDQAEQVQP